MLGRLRPPPVLPVSLPVLRFCEVAVRASSARRYLQALRAEIEREPRGEAATMFLGGGTPNAYGSEECEQLLAGPAAAFSRATQGGRGFD